MDLVDAPFPADDTPDLAGVPDPADDTPDLVGVLVLEDDTPDQVVAAGGVGDTEVPAERARTALVS